MDFYEALSKILEAEQEVTITVGKNDPKSQRLAKEIDKIKKRKRVKPGQVEFDTNDPTAKEKTFKVSASANEIAALKRVAGVK